MRDGLSDTKKIGKVVDQRESEYKVQQSPAWIDRIHQTGTQTNRDQNKLKGFDERNVLHVEKEKEDPIKNGEC